MLRISQECSLICGSALLKSPLRIHHGLREKVNSQAWQPSPPLPNPFYLFFPLLLLLSNLPTFMAPLPGPSLLPLFTYSSLPGEAWSHLTGPGGSSPTSLVSHSHRPALQSFGLVSPPELGALEGGAGTCHFPCWSWEAGAWEDSGTLPRGNRQRKALAVSSSSPAAG